MNKIWRRLASLGPVKEIKQRRPRRTQPITTAWVHRIVDGEVEITFIGKKDGLAVLAEFPGANTLNVTHCNNRTTVWKLENEILYKNGLPVS